MENKIINIHKRNQVLLFEVYHLLINLFWLFFLIKSSFRPDFVLVRQYVRDINIDWTNIILGMQYGAVPSVNSMKALYNFRDKLWIVRFQFLDAFLLFV